MGIRIYNKPEIEDPVLIASWPGIGNIGIIAVDTLRGMVRAEEFGEIEPWDFFYPKKLSIINGELKDLEFPSNKFYWAKAGEKDLIFFIGEEQPAEGGKAYAAGTKAYQMANLVLDVAQDCGCRRVYTSGAAVAPIHHTARPKVWAVPTSQELLDEINRYENTVLMSDIEGRGGQGSITGLNGLLLGVAKRRGLDATCIMGEIPIYLQAFPLPYPKASRSVLEVLTQILGIEIEMQGIDAIVERSEMEIKSLYERFPPEIREELDKLRYVTHIKETESRPITEEDKKRILEDIDKFFKRGSKED
jgi:proteasome assembly chaperone (PAC2) family protein